MQRRPSVFRRGEQEARVGQGQGRRAALVFQARDHRTDTHIPAHSSKRGALGRVLDELFLEL